MPHRNARAFAILVAALLLSTTSLSVPASAHESRDVGPYRLVVGWLSEPAFAGVTNAVDLRVTDTRNTPPLAVEGLEKTLRVEVYQGGLTTPFESTFRARFGVPGAYAADLVPTRAGDYRFVITGTIGDLRLNETFESGPGRFDAVRPQGALQYPEQVPAGAELGAALADARASADQARLLAAAALALGVAAIVLALARGRERRPSGR